MSIKKKKCQKDLHHYAIIKFSDEKGEFELFVFAETLINNRSQLKESGHLSYLYKKIIL